MFGRLFRRQKNEPAPAPEEQIEAPAPAEPEVTEPEAVEPVPVEAVAPPQPAAPPVLPEPVAPQPVAAVAEPMPQEAAPKRQSFFKRLTSVFTGRKIDEAVLEDLEEQLLMSDVSLDTTQVLISGLREAARKGNVPNDDAAVSVLQNEITSLLGAEPTPLRWSPDGVTVWLFAGVNGVGKTTSVGKLAHRLAQDGHRPLLVAADTFRAAAIEQLQEWGRRANCPVVAQQQGADPAAVVYDGLAAAKSRGCDIVLIDTAGRLHTKSNLMNELAKIARIVEREIGHAPEETLLVLDASTGQNGLTQAQSFTGTAPLSGLILTKWDGTAKGGIILSITRETGVPVKLIGIGEKAEDLIDFNPLEFAREMFA